MRTATHLRLFGALLVAALCSWAPPGLAQVLQPALAELLARGTVDSVTQPDGKIIAYGSFDRIGTTPRRNLARFHPNGSLDTSWAPEPDGIVRTVVLDASGNIFVGGAFRRIGGQDAPVFAKLLPGAAAQRDPAFASGVPGLATEVNAIVIANDGSLYAAWAAPAAVHGVTRMLGNGSADGAFALGANNFVLNLALSADQASLFVSGLFTQINATVVAGSLVKVSAATGVQDASWAPLSGTAPNMRVRAVLNDGPGHLLLGGTFAAYPTGFVRVATTGSGSPAAWGPAFAGPNPQVLGYGLARFPDGDVLALGTFEQADALPRMAGVARLAPDGSLRTGWGNVTLPGAIGTQPNGQVNANGVATIWRFADGTNRTRLYQLADADGADLGGLGQSGVALFGGVNLLRRQPTSNRVLVGGASLAEVNGRTSVGVVGLQPNLKPDLAWTSRLGDSVSIGGTAALAASANSVFLGTFGFDPQSSLQVSGLNRIVGSSGALTGWVARRDAGTLMGAIVPTGLALDEAGGFVYAASNQAMRDATNTVVGNGTLLRYALSDGVVDLSWNPAFSGTFNVTPVMAVDANYLYYASSRNVTATDNSAVASLARIPLVGNGRADAGWKPLATNQALRALTLVGGHAYVGGDNALMRVDLASGTIDASWTPGLAGTYSVRDISVALDGSVYLAGSFASDCLGVATSALRLTNLGTLDDNWGVGVDAAVGAILALPDGSVLLSGAFRRVNGKARTGLAHLYPSDVSEYCLQKAVETPTPSANAASLAAVPDGSGRYIAFQSEASNLEASDTDASADVYRVDTACVAGLDPSGAACERVVPVSVGDDESAITGDALSPSISADGSLVAFVAEDAGVMKVYGETRKQGLARRKGAGYGVFMRNLLTSNTFRLGAASGPSARPEIAPGGNAVVFPQPNSALDPGRPGQADIYVMPITRSGASTMPGTRRCVSCKTFDAGGVPTAIDAEGDSSNPVVSADGTWVAWQTEAKNVLPAGSPCPIATTEIVLRNLLTGLTQRMGTPPGAGQCGTDGSRLPDIDYSGQHLVYQTDHSIAGAAGEADVFYVDLRTGTQERISAHVDGGAANGASGQPAISGDGETVAFVSDATNLDPTDVDGNGVSDLFVYSARDRLRRRLARTSVGSEADRASQRPALGYSGSKVLFDSDAGNLSPDSVEGQANVYERASPVDVDKVFRAGFD